MSGAGDRVRVGAGRLPGPARADRPPFLRHPPL